MYLRDIYVESDVYKLRQIVRENPLGILITSLPSDKFSTIQFTHIPWILDVEDEQSSELGKLRGHMARQNPHSKAIIEAIQNNYSSNGCLEQEVAVVFTGPTQSYIPPKFFTETKPSTGKCVPTWNYFAVQAYGKATVLWDTKNPETSMFLQAQVTALTEHSEGNIMGYRGGDTPTPWEVSDAPTSYVDLLRKNIIGIEIELHRLEGKYKMTQEMGKADRQGVVEGFGALGTENGHQMARLVEERGAIKEAAKAKSTFLKS